MKFTTLSVASLEPRDKTFTVRASTHVGFALKVSPQGTKTFLYICKSSGKTLQQALGRYPATSLDDALIAYLTLKNGEGIKSEGLAKSSELKLSDAWRQYIKEEGRNHLTLNVQKQYGDSIYEFINFNRDINCVHFTAKLVKEHLRRFASYKTKANKVKSALSCLCKYLVNIDILDANPCFGLPTKKSKPKTRKLSDDELDKFLPALTNASIESHNKDCIKIVLLTLCRASEATDMDVSELDLDKGRWVLPASRSKNGKEYLIALSKEAVSILRERVRGLRGTKVFTSHTLHPATPSSLRQAIKRLCVTIGIPAASTHDLRRTAAHHINSLGIQSDLISKLLNHTATGVTATVYIQATLFDREDDKREALQRWSESLTQRGFLKNPH